MTDSIETKVALLEKETKTLKEELKTEKEAREFLEEKLEGFTDKLKVGKGIIITLLFMLGGAGMALGTGIKHFLGIE